MKTEDIISTAPCHFGRLVKKRVSDWERRHLAGRFVCLGGASHRLPAGSRRSQSLTRHCTPNTISPSSPSIRRAHLGDLFIDCEA